jgi:hypothetical protein
VILWSTLFLGINAADWWRNGMPDENRWDEFYMSVSGHNGL